MTDSTNTAATSGDAPGDDQWMFDLAAEYESRGNGLYGPITFTAQQLPNFVKAVAARIESAAAPAASTPAAEQADQSHVMPPTRGTGSQLDEAIVGAVARGWCAPENAHKIMDTDLALAITREVVAELASRCRAQGGVTNNTDSGNFAASTTGAAQTVDQVRNQALEEAAKTAEATRVAQVQYGLSIFQDGDGTRDDIATAIRALKSRPTPTHSSEAGE